MNIKKINLFSVLILLVWILQIGFVFGQEELIDICAGEYGINCEEGLSILGTGFEVSEDGVFTFGEGGGKLIFNKGEENEVVLEGNKGIEISLLGEINFIKEGGELSINGNKFENIKPKGKYNEAYIGIDKTTGKILKCEFEVDEEYTYSINGVEINAPSGSFVSYNFYREGELYLEGKEDKNIKLNSVNEPVIISGKNVEVEEGYVLDNGKLNFNEKGEVFVSAGNKAQINGMEIDCGNKMYFFFDEKTPNPYIDYISFEENKINGKTAGLTDIIFKESNPYINIEKGDYVSISGGSFVLENRDSEELIPKITFSPNSDVFIKNDGKTMSFSKEELKFGRLVEQETTSSPLEIILERKRDSSRVFMDNFNRFAIVPENVEEYFADAEGINVKFSARVKYNYIDEGDMEKIIGKPITFGTEPTEHVDEGTKQMILGKLREYWETLTPETKDSVREIIISDNAFDNPSTLSADAFASFTGEVTFRENSRSFKLENFRHEAAHTYHYKVMEEWVRNTPDYLEKKNELNYLSKTILETEDKIKKRELEEERWNLEMNLVKMTLFPTDFPFEKEWHSIAGDYADLKNSYSAANYYDDVPLSGVIKGYGTTNIKEDVATFVEKINKPSYFKPLLSKDNKWNEIYRRKLDLLYEYKFISEDEYNKILEVAGLK